MILRPVHDRGERASFARQRPTDTRVESRGADAVAMTAMADSGHELKQLSPPQTRHGDRDAEEDDDDLVVVGRSDIQLDGRYGHDESLEPAEEGDEEAGPLLSQDGVAIGARRPPLLGGAGGSRNRSGTLGTLSFSFSTHLLPLQLTATADADSDGAGSRVGGVGGGRIAPERNLTFVNAASLVIGMQIGSGIFSSPGVIAKDTGSVGAALLVWAGSGMLAWTGASSFAELGAAIPENGGAQKYLDYAMGQWAGFLFAWTAIVALKPGSTAIIALICAEYVCRILYHTAFTASPAESAAAIPLVVIKLLAVLFVVLVSALNAFSNRAGTRAQVVLTMLKLLALVAVSTLGFVQLGLGRQSSALTTDIWEGTTSSLGRFALALYSGLWSVDGWDQSNYVAGELRDVKRDLPRTINLSMLVVIVLYMLANVSYFLVLPSSEVAQSNTIALDFGKALFGPIGGLVFALVVAVSCVGALNSSIFTTSRLVAVAGREGYIPPIFARMNARRGTPIYALMLSAALTSVMVALGDFKSLVSFYGVCAWTFYLLTVLSLLILRVREPNLERPYRTWLITPIIFSCVSVFLLFMPIFAAPLQALAGFGFIAAGLPVYFLTQSSHAKGFSMDLISRPFFFSGAERPSPPAPYPSSRPMARRHQSSSFLAVPTLPRVSEAASEEERAAMFPS